MAPRTSGLGLLVPFLQSWSHAVSVPTSCEQLQRAAFPKEENDNMEFHSYSCSSKDFFCVQKQKGKKKAFHLPRFLLITYERVPSSTHFEML